MVDRRTKLPTELLVKVLGEAAIRGGCLTDEQLEALQAARLKSLSDALAGQYLSDQQRTKIIDQFLSRMRSESDPAPPTLDLPASDPEAPP